MEVMADLTPKQEKFIQELLRNGGNRRQAYKAAYNTDGMKDASIDSLASRLLSKNVKVRSRYEELSRVSEEKAKEKVRKEEEEAVDDAARAKAFLLGVLASIASGEKGDTVEVMDGDGVVTRREKRTKASDMLSAALKYAEFYGVTPEVQQSREVIVRYEGVEDYGG